MAWNHTKQNKKRQQKKIMKAIFGKSLPLVMILILLIGVLLGLLYKQFEPVRDFIDGLGIFSTTESVTPTPPIDPNGAEMAVHFLDVGQGDCSLLQTTEGSVLIDCSVPEYGDDIVAYLNAQGVTELEYLIITHPDEDHMGAAAYVINNMTVKTVVMNGQEKTTKFFENTLDAMEAKDVEGIIVQPGDVLKVGSALQLTILGPQRLDFSEAKWNNASIVIHATWGDRAFLFTGDAEEDGEADLLEKYASVLKCDVFSAGHHGSRTSNSLALLQAADPDYVVISCGEGNSYGHPHEEALDVFEKVGATVYRTDKDGAIVFVTDGETLTKR